MIKMGYIDVEKTKKCRNCGKALYKKLRCGACKRKFLEKLSD